MTINNQEALRKLYGWPKGRAKDKVLFQLEKHAKNFIQHAPFLVMSTYDLNGRCDASPRGGTPGFVNILDDQTLIIPDAKGNNRVDSLVNIIETGNLGCLFLIPGIEETLRINGTATISTDSSYIDLFKDENNPPKACIEFKIEEIFLHCAKALMRSKLWESIYKKERPGFPTMGKMLNDQLGMNKTFESQEDMIIRYQKDL